MKKVFIITGEHSGDIHASNLVNHLKKIYPDVQLEGIGGQGLKSVGVKLFCDHTKMSAVGFSPSIIFNHITLGKRVVDYIENKFKPDLVVMVDYGAFNLNVSKFLKKKGIKIYYYIPPQVWASRKWRINVIKKNIDKVLCIFPFEEKMYKHYGINTHYCGHPLVSQLPQKSDKTKFFIKHGLDPDKKLVSVFPGSRVFELKNLMKIFLKSAQILKKRHPDLQFCISHAPNLSDNVFDKYLKNSPFVVIKGENQELLSVSDALILASGTVALEAALYQTPMIIAYKGPWVLYFIYLAVRCINKVSLPNIITGKDIVPELIQHKLNPDNVVYETEKLLFDKDLRTKKIEELKCIKTLLSDKVSSEEAANVISQALSE